MFERGVPGETYNIGGHNEMKNIDVVDRICSLLADAISVPREEILALKEYVKDRPGHDLRYAIDASKIQRELGWTPRETFDTGLEKTVRWYLDNDEWVRGVRTGAYRAWIETNYGQRGTET